MGQIDSGSKSNRLLASRRYTHNTLTAAQESFTNVLDLRSEEIYTRAHLIPSSSLPHSGSSQRMAEFTKEGQTVTKYWYRHKLTKSNTNNEVWFFLNPTGSNDGIGAQLINANQQTNFISPKYAVASLATSTTADSTPGYLAAVYKSTSTNTSSLDGDDIVSTNDYQFDYKTGVLQFKSSAVDPTDSQYLYMTVYQYVGQTLKTGLEIQGPLTASNVTFTGESDITTFGSSAMSMISGSWRGELSSSSVTVAGGGISGSSTSTGSFARIVGDNGAFVIDNAKVSGSSVSTGSFAHISAISIVSGSSTATGSFGQVFVGDRLVFKDHQDSGEYIESDGTDLSINVGSNGDINIPANIGMTFGDDGEKIEGDGTDLTISGNNINLTAVADVNIPSGVGLTFATGEKLESDGTDLSITVGSGGDINIPADIGITLGDDGEKIEGDGTDLTVASSNDLNLTATTDINIPANVGLTFGDDGEKIEGDGTDLTIASSGALTLSSAGNTLVETVTFNNGDVTIPGDLTVTGNRIEAQVGSLQVADHTITVGSGSNSSALMQNAGLDWGVSGSVAFLRYRHAGTAISSSAFLEAPKLTVDTITIDAAEIDATGALDIDTGGDLTLSATGDVNIPANIGLTFGDDGEKIEGDGTDLTIASSNLLNLTATTDVKIPVNVGLMFGTHEKIESDDTDLSITVGSGGDINIPADIGLTFGDDGEKIEGDGTDLTISGNNINLTAVADVNIPSGVGLTFATGEKLESDGTDLSITVGTGGDINIPADIGLTFGDDGEKIEGDGTHLTIASSDKLKLDVATDLEIDVDGGDIKITDDGAHVADISATAISGSSVSTGSFAYVNVTSKVSGSSVSTGSFGRLEILGDADIDGTLETDALTINGTTLSETISDTVGAMVGSNTETGISVTYQDGDNTLDFVLDAAQTTITSLFATDIKIGEDNETRIDFGTPNEIHFYAGNQRQLDLEDGVLSPTSDSDVDLGNSSQYFKDAYIDSIITTGNVSGSTVSTGSFGRLELTGNANITGDITLGGSINIGDAAGDDIVLGGEIKSNIIPDADATYDLGSSSKGWNDLHLGSGGVINLDGGDVTLTHSSNLVTITGGSTRVDKLEIDGANDHIDVDTDMVLTAAADITLTPGGANVKPGSDSAIDLGVSGTAFRELFVDAIDLNGQGSISVGGTGRIDLDADDDTSVRASADDVITFEAGAVDIAQMTATQAISGSSIATGSFSYVHVSSKVSGSSVSTGSFGRLEVGGNTNLTGNITIGGNMTLGDADSDSISISADLTSNLIPNADNTYDLGSSAKQWKDLYINGIGYIDQLGTDGDPVTAYINAGEIDGTVIGGESAAAATVTTLSATGDVDLGDATSDTITVTGRFDSDIVPSTDSARDLGTSALQFAEAHIDTGYIDAITATGTSTLSTVDIGAGAIDGTTIGASSAAAATFTTVTTTGNVSGSSTVTGSFGRVQTAGDINASGRVYENNTSVIDHATAMAIVFGG